MMNNVDEIDFVPEREICAAKKNNDSNHFIAYKVKCLELFNMKETKCMMICHQKIQGGGYEKAEESVEASTYYGGADACQGDSGGPLKVVERDSINCILILIYLLLIAN